MVDRSFRAWEVVVVGAVKQDSLPPQEEWEASLLPEKRSHYALGLLGSERNK